MPIGEAGERGSAAQLRQSRDWSRGKKEECTINNNVHGTAQRPSLYPLALRRTKFDAPAPIPCNISAPVIVYSISPTLNEI